MTKDAALGAAVLVDGVVVAWFADMNDETEDFCRSMWFGRWMVWRARPPELVPLTAEEQASVDALARELTAKLRVE